MSSEPAPANPPITAPPALLAAAAFCFDACAEGDATEAWAHLLPAGTVSGRDGRGPYTVDGPAVLAAFAAHGGDLPVDYEHQSLVAADKAGPVPAAGWITALAERADGIWGLVAWTARASELLAQREYRYLSPVFRFEPASGRVLALVGAALTHTPNLAELQAAASQETIFEEPQTVNDTELLERVRYLLNLPTLATIDDMLTHLQRLMERLATAEQAVTSAQAAASTPDPALWVAVSAHRELTERHAALTAEVAAAAAEAAVSAATAAGRLTPAMQPWARAYAAADPVGFAAWSEAAPVVTPAAAAGAAESAGAAGAPDDPVEIARAAQAWQTEQERAAVRVSFAQAVAHVLRGRP